MTIGPIQFDAPLWLALAPALWAAIWWIARRSLSGLSGALRLWAILLRCAVALLLAGAIARPSWRTPAKDVAAVVVLDTSRSIPPDSLSASAAFVVEESSRAGERGRLGVVTTGASALVQALPSARTRGIKPADVTAGAETGAGAEGTDLAAGVRLALAVKPDDAAQRIVLISDGNETAGNLLAAAEAAKAAGVPLDVLPIEYDIKREVLFDRLIVPPAARKGQTTSVRMALTATAPASGRITLLMNDQPVDLNAQEEGVSERVSLHEGVNIITVPIALPDAGPQRFRAVFDPDEPGSDAIAENNNALGVTFVAGEGRALVLADDPDAHEPLVRALREARIDTEIRQTPAAFESLVDLSAYDAVVLADTEAPGFTEKQQEELRAYVHDLGGGLLVIGGPHSFGAGGWIGSTLADAMPLKLDPPQKRQLPRGALVLVMHSCEMPRGNYWGQKVALAAATALSRLDLVGVLEYNWARNGVGWAYPLQEVGDKSGVTNAITKLVYGDMPDLNSIMQSALSALQKAEAGQKHCIVISDGDPQGPNSNLIQQFIAAGVSISTVAVFPHTQDGSGPDVQKMRAVAQATGGNAYLINSAAGLATLPQIFVREAQTVVRNLIWEGDPFTPVIVSSVAEPMRGIGSLPAISGYVIAGEREGLAQTTIKGPGDDPIEAQWQYGLGRATAFTSDATTRWASAWVGWPQFRAFWEQRLRWAMRPTGSANTQVTTQTHGNETIVTVDALAPDGSPLNFARIRGRVVTPDLQGVPLELRMTGPGRYEGKFKSEGSGSYVVNMQYDAPGGIEGAAPDRGVIQAAVVRPYADERRALQSNAALLKRAAELTGGRVLTGDASKDDLFTREGFARMPVTRTSIWLLVALLAAGLFLVDVGVRRVRIDIPAIRRFLRSALSKRERASEKQIDAMRAARERTRTRLPTRAPGTPGEQPITLEPSSAAVKFEASAEALSRGASAPGASGVISIDSPGAPSAPASPRPPTSDESEEGGISRLKRAEQRARENLPDSDSGSGGDQNT